MTPEKLITLLVLLAAVAALLWEWLPVGLTAIAAPLSLVLVGKIFPDMKILSAPEMWEGLSHGAVVAVAGMYVVSAGVSRTGALGFLGDALSHVARRGNRRILAFMMISVAAMSAFINNTTVVLVCLPLVLSMCERMEHPPSRYLIPLSFGAIFGGMMTLVGTSTNLVVAEEGRKAVAQAVAQAAEDESSPLPVTFEFDPGMWDFAPLGIVFVVVGVIYMAFVGVKLLPDRVALSMTLTQGALTEYVTEAEILAESTLAGRHLGEVMEKYRLRVLQIIRDDVIEIPSPDLVLEVGDVLLVKGGATGIIDLTSGGTALLPGVEATDMKARQVGMTLAEVIVPPRSRWIDRKVTEIGFRARYGVSVIAVQRHGHHIRQKVGELNVEPADMLLVQGTVESLRNLRASENLILVEGVQSEVTMRSKAPVALGVLGLFVTVISTGFLDITTGAVFAATAMVLTRCLTVQEAYHSVDWNVLFLLAGFLGVGRAMGTTGLASDAAMGLLEVVEGAPPWVIIGLLYALTAFLSDLMSNQATALIMIPVMLKTAILLEARPEPFLMTVAFAASAAFLTPVGYQTNLLVFAPGGYRFRDFIVVGLPLRLLFCIVAAVFIPVVYPLQ